MKKSTTKKNQNQSLKKYEPVIMNMLGPVIQIVQSMNPSEFRTHEAEIKDTLEKQFEEQQSENVWEAFMEIFINLDLDSAMKEAEKELKIETRKRGKDDIRFKELNDLILEVEAIYPNVAWIVFFHCNPLELLGKSFEPVDLIQEFESLKGERAARAAIRMFREVAEMLYCEYVTAIYQLIQLLEKKQKINMQGTFGVMIDQLPARLAKHGYYNLVDPDVGWLRNACCHSHWRYDPKTDKLVMWDQKRPKREFSALELYEKASNMYTMVMQNYMGLIFIYLRRKIYIEWALEVKYAQANLRALIEQDPKHLAYLESLFDQKFAHVKPIEFKGLKMFDASPLTL